MRETEDLKENLRRLERKLYVVYAIGLLILLSLSLVSNYVLKTQAARQATSLIKRMVQRGDFRETIYTLNDAKLDFFDAVVYYSEDGKRMFSLPADLDPAFASRQPVFSRHTRLPINLYFDSDERHKTGSVLFIFNRFSHAPYAALIWLFFLVGTVPVVRTSRRKVIEDYQRHVLLSEEAARADLARRVRHDIRSPLGALQIATRNLAGLQVGQQAIIHRVTERIKEIVSELELIRVAPNASAAKESDRRFPQSILTLVQDIIQEKRAQLAYRGHIKIVPEFSGDAFFLFADINGSEFKRGLSNLIDNAVEASEARGRVTVSIRRSGHAIEVAVKDTGKGIRSSDLDRIAEKGFTTKPSGSGLGLYYAKKMAIDAGGELQVESTEGYGATVTLKIPACDPPAWYVPFINVPIGGTVVILDDQESAHLSWKMRLDELRASGAEFEVVSHRSASELSAWFSDHGRNSNKALYLLDYDLGQNEMTGLDVARELDLAENAVLVTGHFDSEEIQRRCTEQKIGLLPKPYVSLIELSATSK